MGAISVNVPAKYASLEHVAMEARPYPTYLLENAETGLCLFSAAFMGHNEAVHFALEDVQTTCIDIDSVKLEAMAGLYPEHWKFICRDAWEFAEEAAKKGKRWDVVSVDTFRGNATLRSLASLDLWCAIADEAVVATLEDGQSYEKPDGWKPHLLRRNSEVFWLVLTRD
jgi:hypothetical protein